jgi:hypothetical protein
MIRQLPPNTTVDELFRLLMAGSGIIDGQLVSIAADATTSVQSVRHGLGRVYRGAFVVFGDQPQVLLTAVDPATQAAPATFLYYQLSASIATNARAWCF